MKVRKVAKPGPVYRGPVTEKHVSTDWETGVRTWILVVFPSDGPEVEEWVVVTRRQFQLATVEQMGEDRSLLEYGKGRKPKVYLG